MASSPFKMEILNDSIGYLRLGSITKANLGELDAGLKSLAGRPVSSLIIDLRSTPECNDYQLAGEFLQRFCPNGKPLFSIRKASQGLDNRQTGTDHPSGSDILVGGNQEPSFKGPVMVLLDRENAGASEVVAAVLRINARAILIGERTKGEGVEFADFKLGTNKILRIAVSEIVLPEGPEIYPDGVKPDLLVEVSPEVRRKVLAKGLEQGVAQLIFETERPRMNEASLVAGTNPEMDAYQLAQKAAADKAGPAEPVVRDTALQRAVDLIATIGIYGKNFK